MNRKKTNKNQYNWLDHKFTRISKTAMKLMGFPGRMLYPSKSIRQPTTIFNANIFNSRAKKIWFGDMEIELDAEKLLALSKRLGPLFIMREMDGRFLEWIPTIGYLREEALVIIENGAISYSPDFKRYRDWMAEKKKKELEEEADA